MKPISEEYKMKPINEHFCLAGGMRAKFATWLIAAAVSFPFSTASAGTVDFSPTTLTTNINGCVSTGVDRECNPAGINLMDSEDDTINLFSLDADVYGFDVIVDSSGLPPYDTSDIGSANVLLNGDFVGILSTASPSVSAVFVDPSLAQVIQIVNTDAALLNYDFYTTPVPVPAAAWLFGSGLLGLIGVARRKAA
jgi:hypothetical protein